MRTITLPEGDVNVHIAGPAEALGPPVVFVHGFLVSATLWTKAAGVLAAQGVRSFAPDLPLGSHEVPLGSSADRSPRGVARLIIHLLEALDLHDVTLVGNDTGGALCQFVIDEDPSRVGRLVLTNCDAFERFPSPAFKPLFWLVKSPTRMRLGLMPTRWRALRHSPLGFGQLMAKPRDATLTRGWMAAALSNREVREDAAAFARAVDAQDLVEVGERLHRFRKPVRLVWGAADRNLRLTHGHRLAAAFGSNAEVIEIPGGTTFVPVDHPTELADAIIELGAAALHR